MEHVKSIKSASFELWHTRLGHVNFSVISLLNKLGHFSVISILPKPYVCFTCQLSKGRKLSFALDSKHATYVLSLVHCSLWGPFPVISKDGYCFYVIFMDEFSRFL